MNACQQHTLAGATGVELVLALYDGALRFLYRAQQCIEEGDVHGRRVAVKRVTDIFIYLQTTLRTDVCSKTTNALADFYAAMFQLTLEASYYDSLEQLSEVIHCVKNVRDAWAVVARDAEAQRVLPRDLRGSNPSLTMPLPIQPATAHSSWSA